MKYLVSLAIIFLCCGFTLCDKIVRKEKVWELYIYPDCSDSTTYIKQEYSIATPYKERLHGTLEWKHYTDGYHIEETLYMHDTIKWVSNYYHNHSDTILVQNINFNGVWNSFYFFEYPSERNISINDSFDLYISYFKDGSINSCRLVNQRNRDSSGVSMDAPGIEWDILHQNKWIGLMNVGYKLPKVVDVENDDNPGVVMWERKDIDSTWKTGTWRKYNSAGIIIDSAFYK